MRVSNSDHKRDKLGGRKDAVAKPMKSAQRPEGEKGFTLIEAVMSVAIMSVVSLGTIYLFTYATAYNSGATDRALVIALAQQRLERLRSVPFGDSALNATSTTGTTEELTFEGHSLTLVTRIVNTSSTLKTVTITITPRGGSQPWTRIPVEVTMQRAATVTGPNFQRT